MFYKIVQKVTKNIGYFLRKFVTKNFTKSPNLVTLIAIIYLNGFQ